MEEIKNLSAMHCYTMEWRPNRSTSINPTKLGGLFTVDTEKVYGIKKVIFNDPATIVFWNDGSKTVVKAHDEPFDPEKGLAMAISKKFLGNKGNYYNKFKKWLPEEEDYDLPMTMNEVLENLADTIENLSNLSKSL